VIGIVDGNNLAFRYVFSLSDPGRAAGYAAKVLVEQCKYHNLDGIIVVWDGGSGKRKQLFEEYKENRSLEPEQANLYQTLLKDLQTFFQVCGFVQCRVEGDEADDVIATFTRSIFLEDKVVIFSNDRDFFSLLSDRVSIWNWKEYRTLGWFQAEYGVEPSEWVKIKSLAGDASDNIKGVQGIGVKRALKVIQDGKYGEYENREDVILFRKILDFMLVDEDKIIESLDFGRLDKFRFGAVMEYCGLGMDLWEEVLAIARKTRIRAWKLDKLERDMKNCRTCPLFESAKHTVVFRGVISDILVVGEAPGYDEDLQGYPFVGKAGRELERWLGMVNLSNKVLISNVVWHRPTKNGNNRAPTPKEIETCSKKGILPLIDRLAPRLIIALGNTAANFITGNKINITKDSGLVRVERFGYPIDVFIMPHPSSVGYNSKMMSIVEEQLNNLEGYLRTKGMLPTTTKAVGL